jgi:methylated-DNA-[protein]-cysteine S-methyltransferase
VTHIETSAKFALFSTSIGRCAIAWRGQQILATSLPEKSDTNTRARIVARAGGAEERDLPAFVQHAVAAMAKLLAGERIDLSFIDCNFSELDPLSVRVYQVTRTILPGETLTYGDIAAQLGDKMLARPVGQALGKNPFPIIVPCHRVLGAKRRLTGFSANGGVATKLRMLAIEGVQVGEIPELFGELPLAMKPVRPN